MVGPYVLSLFLGGALAMLAYPVYQWLRAKKWGPRLAATADDLESAKLAIQAEVATAYFGLRALDAQHTLLEETIQA